MMYTSGKLMYTINANVDMITKHCHGRCEGDGGHKNRDKLFSRLKRRIWMAQCEANLLTWHCREMERQSRSVNGGRHHQQAKSNCPPEECATRNAQEDPWRTSWDWKACLCTTQHWLNPACQKHYFLKQCRLRSKLPIQENLLKVGGEGEEVQGTAKSKVEAP